MKIVIVSGAGSGLGRALSRQFVMRGDTVIAIGRNEAALRATGEGLPRERYHVSVGDVADPAAMAAIVRDAHRDHGRIDGLFANAAIYPRESVVDGDPHAWMNVMQVNVGGILNLARAVLPPMIEQAGGRIVAVGSFAHLGPIPDSSAYSASKAALHTLVKAIAVEVGPDYPDILVNEWVPGSLRTGMGVPDGIPPETAAAWGLEIFDKPAGSPSGRVYDGRNLVEPPRSFKRRVLNKLLGR